tara:strand:+ start:211 stop:561 length:351 start_codon:yes stop_codon:yes gene_type:complete
MRILSFLFVTYLNKKSKPFFMNTQTITDMDLKLEDDFSTLQDKAGLDTRIQVNKTKENVEKENIEKYFFKTSLLKNLTSDIALHNKLKIWNYYNQESISANILAGGLLDDWLYEEF